MNLTKTDMSIVKDLAQIGLISSQDFIQEYYSNNYQYGMKKLKQLCNLEFFEAFTINKIKWYTLSEFGYENIKHINLNEVHLDTLLKYNYYHSKTILYYNLRKVTNAIILNPTNFPMKNIEMHFNYCNSNYIVFIEHDILQIDKLINNLNDFAKTVQEPFKVILITSKAERLNEALNTNSKVYKLYLTEEENINNMIGNAVFFKLGDKNRQTLFLYNQNSK